MSWTDSWCVDCKTTCNGQDHVLGHPHHEVHSFDEYEAGGP